MFIEVEKNLNCRQTDIMVFREMASARPVCSLRVEKSGRTISVDVTGVDAEGKFVTAFAQKVEDSGTGVGFLIYGGAWGIRLRPETDRQEVWDLNNPRQWGEPYMIYADEADIDYGMGQENHPH